MEIQVYKSEKAILVEYTLYRYFSSNYNKIICKINSVFVYNYVYIYIKVYNNANINIFID